MNWLNPMSPRMTKDKSQHLMFIVCCLTNTKLLISRLTCVLDNSHVRFHGIITW